MVSAQIRGCIHFFVSVGIEDNRLNSETSSPVKTQGLPRSLEEEIWWGQSSWRGGREEPAVLPC